MDNYTPNPFITKPAHLPPLLSSISNGQPSTPYNKPATKLHIPRNQQKQNPLKVTYLPRAQKLIS